MPHDSDDIFEADNATKQGRGPIDHPTMLGSCARAASREESRFRVNYPNSRPRAARIFALDEGAAEAMYAVTEQPWNDAHFLTVANSAPVDPGETDTPDLPLAHPDGSPASLPQEIEGADLIVLLATRGDNEGAAEVIAREAWRRKIMCAVLALGEGASEARLDRVVNSMRRFATVLVVAREHDYIPAMLSALRA